MKKSLAWLFACLMVGTFAGCEDSSSDSDNAECTGSEVKCADGSHTKKCTDGKWSDPVACPETAAICDSSLNKCVACAKGAKECAGEDQIKECKEDGSWGNPVSCQDPTPVCSAEQKECVAGTITTQCTNGEKRCDGEDKLQTCAEGNWGTSEQCPVATPKCDSVQKECVEDAPAQICTPNAKECEGSNQIKECNAEGTAWGAPVDCIAPTPLCDAVDKECVAETDAKICTPNAKECVDGNKIKQCSADGKSWGAETECDAATPVCDSSNPDDQKCIAECTGTETLCLDKVNIKTCASGKWNTKLCGDDTPICDENLNQCVECTPNTDFCQMGNGGKSGDMYHCTDAGKKGESFEHCTMGCNDTFTACQGGGSEDKCKDGETKCAEDSKQYYVCNAGEWETTPSDCRFDSVCNKKTNKCECEPGKQYCFGNGEGRSDGLYVCQEDKTYPSQPTDKNYCACLDDHSDCDYSIGKKCQTGKRKCNGTEILECPDGKWEKATKSCDADNVICNDKVGSVCIPAIGGVCTMGANPESICNDGILYQCTDGLFDAVPKPADEPACGGDVCLKPSEVYCITKSLESGSRQAEYSKECRNTSYCIGATQYHCDASGKITEELCPNASKSAACVLINAISTLPVVSFDTRCDNNGFQTQQLKYTCDGTVLSFEYNGKAYRLADCKDYGLVCKDGKDGGCVAKSSSSESGGTAEQSTRIEPKGEIAATASAYRADRRDSTAPQNNTPYNPDVIQTPTTIRVVKIIDKRYKIFIFIMRIIRYSKAHVFKCAFFLA